MNDTPFDEIFARTGGESQPAADPVKRAQALSRAELPKRFYTAVSIASGEAGFEIRLDERTIRTPARSVLAVAAKPVAEAIAAEWDAQRPEINPATMPVTRIVNSAIDGVSKNREAVIDDIAGFARSDLLCYRAEDPERLVERQNALWDPVLRATKERLGASFVLAGGIMPVDQPVASVSAVRDALALRDDLALAALHTLTALTGSVLLALALDAGDLSFDGAWQAAHVDEDWNRELWGEDAEAAMRREKRRIEAQAAALILGRI